MRVPRIVAFAMIGFAVGGASGVGWASGRRSHLAVGAPAEAEGEELSVPRATGDVRIDGELDDGAWSTPVGRTGPFTSGGSVARPYSDARVMWRDGTLYLALYAADENIVAPAVMHDAPLWAGDSFHVVFRRGNVEMSIDVSPRGVVTDGQRVGGGPFDARWESRARVAVDRDGTIDDPSDEDEEWVVEMAIPMDAFGLTGTPGERLGLEVGRCDRVRALDGSARRTCASWGDARSAMVLR